MADELNPSQTNPGETVPEPTNEIHPALAEVSPTVEGTPEDLGPAHIDKPVLVAQRRTARNAMRQMFEDMNEEAAEASVGVLRDPAAEATAKEARGLETKARKFVGSAARDVAIGVVQAPLQITGGVIDAVNQIDDTTKDLGAFIEQFIPGVAVGFDESGDFSIKLASGEELKKTKRPADLFNIDIPTTKEADTATGAMIRGISKFVAGFVGAGKLKPFKALAQAGTGGQITAAALKGAVSDFTVFDPHEERLSDLIQEFPALQNPVSEFLEADPEDNEAVGRFKNAVEGLGLGSVVDGLVIGARLIKTARAAKTSLQSADEAAEEAAKTVLRTAEDQRNQLVDLVGDPEAKGPVFKIRDVVGDVDVAAKKLGKGQKAQGEIFINWARINSPDDVKQVMQDMADTFAPGIDKARRGKVRTWNRVQLDAEKTNAWDVLTSRKVGQPLNDSQTQAVRELWARSGSMLEQIARDVRSNPGDLNRIALRRQIAVHNAIQEQVVAARTETARALRAWAIPVGDNAAFSGQIADLRLLLENERSIDDMAAALTSFVDSGMQKEADAFIHGAGTVLGFAKELGSKTSSLVRQLYYSSMLSGPHTHARNNISNTAFIGLEMLERKAASIVGKAFGQQNIPNGESLAMMFGATQGIKDGLRVTAKGRRLLANRVKSKLLQKGGPKSREIIEENPEDFGTLFKSISTGDSGFGIGKVEPGVGSEGFSDLGGVFGIEPDSTLGRIAQGMDTVTTMPTRALTAADEVAKTVNFQMEIYAQAFRKAAREVESGTIEKDVFKDRLAGLIYNPDEVMRLGAQSLAQTGTFTRTPLDTRTWRFFKGMGDFFPVLGKLVLPFRRTPYNLNVEAFERTPLAPISRRWRQDIAAGGARADLAWTRMMMGTGVLLVLGDLALSGHITGEGPSNPGKRRLQRRRGIQPMSIRVPTGDGPDDFRYFSYRGLEPIGTHLGIAANIVEILEFTDWDQEDSEVNEVIIAASAAVAEQVISQQFMSGLSAILDTMHEPERYGESYFERIARPVIPTGVAQLNPDKTIREVNGMIDAIRSRTPGLSKNLPPMHDLWGREIKKSSGLGTFYDNVSPLYSKAQKTEPIDAELNELELYLSRPAKRTTFEAQNDTGQTVGVTVNLKNNPRIYEQYVRLQGNELTETTFGGPITARGFASSGMGLKDELNALVTGEHEFSAYYDILSGGPEGGRAEYIRAIVNAYRKEARKQIVQDNPELLAEVETRAQVEPGKFDF